MTAARLAQELGGKPACDALGLSRSTFYRQRSPQSPHDQGTSPSQHWRALDEAERQAVVEVLHQDRFVDKATLEVYATLLDEGTYLCSPSTMYRILHQEDEVKERRNQVRHPSYRKP